MRRPHWGRKRRIDAAALGVLGALVAPLASAAEAAQQGAEKLRGFGLNGGDVGAPGFGRVITVFILVAALAWGATWILRRYGLRSAGIAPGPSEPIRHLVRGTLPGGVVCHVIETQGRRVLITTTRNGVSTLVLGDAPADSPAAQPPAPPPTPPPT